MSRAEIISSAWSHQEAVTAWVVLGIWTVGMIGGLALAILQERRQNRKRRDETARLYRRFGAEPPKS